MKDKPLVFKDIEELFKKTDSEIIKIIENDSRYIDYKHLYGQNLLHLACKNNTNLEIIKYLIETNKFNLNEKTKDGDNLLHLACINNTNLEIIKYLIETNKFNLNEKTKDGDNLLHLALLNDNCLKIIQFLMEIKELDVNEKDENGHPLLHLACYTFENTLEEPQIIKFLIESDRFNLNEKNRDGDTVLHVACSNNINIDLIKLLIEKGADYNILNSTKQKPLELLEHEAKESILKYTKEIELINSSDNSISLKKEIKNQNKLETIKDFEQFFKQEESIIISLVEKNLVDLGVKSPNGSSLLHWACYMNMLNLTKYLISTDKFKLVETAKGGENALHFACANNNNLEVIKFLIDTKEFDLKAKTAGGENALLLACINNTNVEVIKWLIDTKEFDLKAKTAGGNNGLLLACKHNTNVEVIKCLIDTGLFKTSYIHNGLLLACQHNTNVEVIKYLIETNKFDLNGTMNQGYNALHLACWENTNPEIIKYLIDTKEFDLTAKDNNGYNALHLACWKNTNPEIIKYLIETNKFDLTAKDNNGYNAFHLACMFNNTPEVIKHLMETNEFYLDGKYNNPLHLACMFNTNPEVIKYLIENGVPTLAQNYKCKRPLDISFERSNNACSAIVKVFVKLGKVDVNENSVFHGPLLHRACKKNNLELVKFLIKNGADVNLLDMYYKTPLDISLNETLNFKQTQYAYFEMVKVFVQLGQFKINKKATGSGETLLHKSCARNNAELVKFLLENDADVNVLDNDDRTPLELSFAQSNNACSAIVKVFVKLGKVDVNKKFNNGNTLLHKACSGNNLELVKFLLGKGADVNVLNNKEQTALQLTDSEMIQDYIALFPISKNIVELKTSINIVNNIFLYKNSAELFESQLTEELKKWPNLKEYRYELLKNNKSAYKQIDNIFEKILHTNDELAFQFISDELALSLKSLHVLVTEKTNWSLKSTEELLKIIETASHYCRGQAKLSPNDPKEDIIKFIQGADYLKTLESFQQLNSAQIIEKFKEHTIEEIKNVIGNDVNKTNEFYKWHKYTTELIEEYNLQQLFAEVDVISEVEFVGEMNN